MQAGRSALWHSHPLFRIRCRLQRLARGLPLPPTAGTSCKNLDFTAQACRVGTTLGTYLASAMWQPSCLGAGHVPGGRHWGRRDCAAPQAAASRRPARWSGHPACSARRVLTPALYPPAPGCCVGLLLRAQAPGSHGMPFAAARSGGIMRRLLPTRRSVSAVCDGAHICPLHCGWISATSGPLLPQVLSRSIARQPGGGGGGPLSRAALGGG